MAVDEIPLYNWFKCVDGQVEYVVIAGKVSKIGQMEAWTRVYDSYLKEFGLNKTYKRYLLLLKKKALLEAEYVITGDRFKLTKIEVEERKLKNMLETQDEGITSDQALIYMSKWLGYRINPKEITAKEYFVILKEYGKANKKE